MLDFNWSSGDVFEIDEDVINKWLCDVCHKEMKSLEEVAVVFMSDDALLKMNNDYLAHDYFTDIITFDYCVEEAILGDLFISTDRVKENAVLANVSFLDELYRVLVHGVLHLCGYGDKSNEEEKLMRQKEDFYLNKLKGFT